MGVVITTEESGIWMLANPYSKEPDSVDVLANELRGCFALQIDADGDWWGLIKREGRLRWTPLEEIILEENEEEEYPDLCEVVELKVVGSPQAPQDTPQQ